MPRIHRLIAPGVPHHITQRGNYQQKVFHRDDDRRLYLALLAEFLPQHGIALEAYCLMSNHVHLIVTPKSAQGLSKAMQRIHSDYSRSLHLRLRQTGHLWQARFHSTALDNQHYEAAMLYVERNPVRAQLVDNASQWRWSSAQAHLGMVPSGFLNLKRWAESFNASNWRQWLLQGRAQAALEDRIRQATLTGFPSGTDAFCTELRQHLGHPTSPGKAGRPRKPPASQALTPATHQALFA